LFFFSFFFIFFFTFKAAKGIAEAAAAMSGRVAKLSERINALVGSETGRSVRARVGRFVDGDFILEKTLLVSGETIGEVRETVGGRIGRDCTVYLNFEGEYLCMESDDERLAVHSDSKAMTLYFV
jgi:hypothetical protein